MGTGSSKLKGTARSAPEPKKNEIRAEFYDGAPENVKESYYNGVEFLRDLFGDEVEEFLPQNIVKLKYKTKHGQAAAATIRDYKPVIGINEESLITTEVMAHEITHLITNELFKARYQMDEDANFTQGRKDVYRMAGIRASKAADKANVSRYGSTNAAEFFSEIVARKYNNRNNPYDADNPVVNAGIEYLRRRLAERGKK